MNALSQMSVSIFLLLSWSAFAEQTNANGYQKLMIADNNKEINTKLKAEVTPITPTLQKCSANAVNNKSSEAKIGTNICLTINGKSITATLNNSVASKDFISMLPISLKLEDFAKTEKISYLPRKLSLTGAASGYAPAVGDITYYAPWGNLAIFYKESKVGFARGLISLGKIDGDINHLLGADGAILTIEKIE
ncbi:MAG: cyclophilin-like fold protein [Methylophilus sp.]|jgi:hypothetical protein